MYAAETKASGGGSWDGVVLRELASHQCGPGSIRSVAGSRPCSERFFSGYSGFPLSSKTNIFKFQFDLYYCQTLYHEPLVQEIVQALPVLLTLNN